MCLFTIVKIVGFYFLLIVVVEKYWCISTSLKICRNIIITYYNKDLLIWTNQPLIISSVDSVKTGPPGGNFSKMKPILKKKVLFSKSTFFYTFLKKDNLKQMEHFSKKLAHFYLVHQKYFEWFVLESLRICNNLPRSILRGA